ncbi:L,D-transpeptidase [Tropicimonas sp. IMCC6043]|uniref:L,D-transpeptidase n=1 Tax=Tropicimonas sp. IMCC6043 TaxID=2510645 RepID=UPI00101B77BD|nr:L,D-transpeptidase [Tropicimonas sp. IMCC6043]RYH09063.1 L,D-transpeptidase [Tropicimonas sp. IMCC6043]
MISRRAFFAGLSTGLAAPGLARAATGSEFRLDKQFQPKIVKVRPQFQPGTIHVELGRYFLYFILEPERAIRYGVAIGEEGRNLKGSATVGRKAEWPSWTPTANMIRREPQVYAKWAGGLPGGPENPLGARALYLYRGGRDTRYRIHGTPQPWTIGSSVSSGCIRLTNEAVIDLYPRVPVGTKVTIHYPRD